MVVVTHDNASMSDELPDSATSVRVIASDGADGVARDYLRSLTTAVAPLASPHPALFMPAAAFPRDRHPAEIVLFLQNRISPRLLQICEQIAAASAAGPMRCVVVITSLSRHLGDRQAEDLESLLQKQLRPHLSQLTVLRTGHILSLNSTVTHWLRRLRGLAPLISGRLTSTFLSGPELFDMINQELSSAEHPAGADRLRAIHGVREISIPGRRRKWTSLLQEQRLTGSRQTLFTGIASVLSFCGLPWLLCCVLSVASRIRPSLRCLHFDTLQPRSVRELLSLCNRHSAADIQIAGYNNGVNHFGWKFPERTIVQTTRLPGRVRLQGDRVRADAGLTLKHCIRWLHEAGREFLVVPNYSWISMGTIFFVPVHGSGRQVSTLGDTIEDVLLYDCDAEQFVRTRRGEALFRERMYDMRSHWLLLRLTLQVGQQLSYRVERTTLDRPTAADIQQLFGDPLPSHVEVRKSSAASSHVAVHRWYADPAPDTPGARELPRDRIGRLWDRIEETPVLSGLFHWFVRTQAFHVELFLKPDEFTVFWEHHQKLPLSKIQLRLVRQDGMQHSACRDSDCISADLFMTRRNSDVFRQFIASHLSGVRINPGKQSL